ncbi:MAG: hypothetical protein NTW80_09880 [Deltaproteobacteria bacterium]|nr:hypothetical protein [Deltaproteobacteria bacterium]
MSHTEYFEGSLVERDRQEWSPTAKLVLAFVIGLLLLSPAILGIHWEVLLP